MHHLGGKKHRISAGEFTRIEEETYTRHRDVSDSHKTEAERYMSRGGRGKKDFLNALETTQGRESISRSRRASSTAKKRNRTESKARKKPTQETGKGKGNQMSGGGSQPASEVDF